MIKFSKEKFLVDFGIYGKKEKEGYGTEVFFIYKNGSEWTVCHKQSNLKLTPLSNKLLAKAKSNVCKVQTCLNWDGVDGFEIAANNGMTGKEFKEAMWSAIYD